MNNRFSKILLASAFLASAVGASAVGACQKADKKGDEAKTTEGQDPAASRPVDPKTSGPKPGDIPAPADVAAPPADAQKTALGVSYKVLQPASAPGDKPSVNDTVEVHYTGWTTDGKMFDSSVKRGQPASFGLSKVIPGWTDGLQVMTVGEKTRFWIPEEHAYQGRQGAPAGMLVFDVELLSIKKAPEAPADVAAPPADAKKTKSGVSYKVLTSGDGKTKPRSFDKVKVHYTGWTTDGKMFDSSLTRSQPAEFAVDGVIAGWTEALQLMSVGDKWRVWIPEDQAYAGKPGRPAGMLVFDVELLEVQAMPEPPKVPTDVAAPPKNAKKTDKGVFYKVLSKGKGGAKPAATDKVEVHYSGWTTDGKMFDSSVTRGKTATFPLTAVIAGWTDGLQVMSVGEKTRFWIPEDLAYKGQPGKPAGMLVFDVELVSIVGQANATDAYKTVERKRTTEAPPAK